MVTRANAGISKLRQQSYVCSLLAIPLFHSLLATKEPKRLQVSCLGSVLACCVVAMDEELCALSSNRT